MSSRTGTRQRFSPDECHDPGLRHSRSKRLRTRTGCWNCRLKRKKCDEQRPACGNCTRRQVACEWGLRLSFRPENIETIPVDHPSLQQHRLAEDGPFKRVQIIDVTSEIIRDYWDEVDPSSTAAEQPAARPEPRTRSWPLSYGQTHDIEHGDGPEAQSLPTGHVMSHQAHLRTRNSSVGFGSRLDHTETATSSPRSLELIQSAAAHLLDLGSASDTALPTTDTDHDVLQARAYGEQGTGASPASDGIFMPGSAYLQFHSALRNHTFHAARSAFPSRCASPERAVSQYGREDVADFAQSLGAPIADIAIFGDASTLSTVPTPAFVELSQQHEYELWKNWVDEIAPWLDKLDDERHFGRALPPLAREHPHLKFSILALSARQLERKDPVRCSLSLALYQEAIHHLVPQLQTRTTTVVASCVVLCVLEMMSCSPKMWRRHLDGCASLILSMGIHGLSGGLEQALFWCFARMDLCGGFISDEQMIIPIGSWLPKSTPDHDDHLLYRSLGFNMYTNYVVHLCGQVVDLLAGSNTGTQGFEGRWHDLFDNLNKWYDDRLPGMKPVLDLSPSETDFSRPFPILLFSSPSAIAGNQLYHTGALLLLQQKPRGVRLKPGTRSVLWHARRISAISISNHNHACWTNCVQPLWFAGRVMSHPAEHRAILETYDLIERETGWGARWRADDLKEYWGDLGGS